MKLTSLRTAFLTSKIHYRFIYFDFCLLQLLLLVSHEHAVQSETRSVKLSGALLEA